jgi:prepilin-type N-terminal cleavage/methylation domain-containing protein
MITRTPLITSRVVRSSGGTRHRRRQGLSLVEVMIGLVIAASLLTAAAVAFNASSQVVERNEAFFRATQAARVSMHQILTQVRRGSVNLASTQQELRLITAATDGGGGDDDVTYKYLPAEKKLVLVTNDDLTDPDYVLANNVTALSFAAEPGQDYTKAPCVVRVTVRIRVQVGDNDVTLSGSAAPRRNLVY